MMSARQLLLTIVVAFVAGVAGLLAGRALMSAAPKPETALHAVLYGELDLDAKQQRALEALNTAFYEQRAGLERQMRAENAALSRAIAREHGYGPAVARAVDQSHHTMGALQKITLEHVFAMRAILRPDQLARYDAAVARTLASPSR